MGNFSLTYLGALAGLIASVTLLERAEALDLINATVVVITTLVTLFGRYRHGDMSVIGFKR